MVGEHGAKAADILRAHFTVTFHHAVADFKHTERHFVALVRLQGLEQSGDQCGAGSLEISRFGVSNGDVIIPLDLDLFGNFFNTAEAPVETLSVPAESQLLTQ